MKKTKLLLSITIYLAFSIVATVCAGNATADSYNDGHIKYNAVQLTIKEKDIVNESLKSLHKRYDPKEKMIIRTVKAGGNVFAIDAQENTEMHEVLASFNYAVSLLDLGDEQYTQRAFDVLEKTIATQDQDTTSKSCGVWPWYLEEPLATKKSVIDYNWADFCSVRLLDIWMGHQDRIPEASKGKIKDALILAGKAIQRRNVDPSYTNIAVMGTYAVYMISHLFNLQAMKVYAENRLTNFYNYTLDKGCFSEYNSPSYTFVAMDELAHMKAHIVEPTAKHMVDSLYFIGWRMVARHYHKPTGQWTGPHGRFYGTLVGTSFYALLNEASGDKIFPDMKERTRDVKIKHEIPESLMHYFLSPVYPRTETDVFENKEPQVIGSCYMTDKYALSTASLSSMWNQRHPFMLYWGTIKSPKYLQIQFLHDNFDFSSAYFVSTQKENKALAGIKFFSNGGDRHVVIDRLKEGKFLAKDLRLRFKFGNVKSPDQLTIPDAASEPFSITLDSLQFNLQLCEAMFGELKGHWEKGGDESASWIDYVFHSGPQTEFDLTKINKAAMSFTFSVDTAGKPFAIEKPNVLERDDIMEVRWSGFSLEIPMKPQAPDKIFL